MRNEGLEDRLSVFIQSLSPEGAELFDRYLLLFRQIRPCDRQELLNQLQVLVIRLAQRPEFRSAEFFDTNNQREKPPVEASKQPKAP